MLQRLKSITENQTGFSLIELLVALVIASSVVTAATMVFFQVFNGEARSSNHMDAISRVQNAGQRISADAGMAQTWDTDDDAGTSKIELLTLTWTEWESNDKYKIVYSILDNELQRERYINESLDATYNFEYIYYTDPDTGVPITYCIWDGTKLKFTLTAIVGAGSQQQSETREYDIKPRPSI